jgi:predicted RNA-binding Zn ribbon-like protein
VASIRFVSSITCLDGNQISLLLNCVLMETSVKLLTHLELVGGHLALDFVNSVGGLVDPDPDSEALRSYDDLLAWSQRAGSLDKRAAQTLARHARRRPEDAKAAFARALELRELADRVIRPVAAGDTPDANDLAALRAEESIALARAELAPAGDGPEWRWQWRDTDDLEAPLWPLAHAVVDLLTHGRLERLRSCANCRWLFLDESRNASRRWCSMDGCGTDVKKRRYVQRRRERRRSTR